MRLSKPEPGRPTLVAGDETKSGTATADLEPCRETPRKLGLLVAGAGRVVALGVVDHVGEGVETGAGVPRRSGVLDMKPGGGVAIPGEGDGETFPGADAGVPVGGATVPAGADVFDGSHAGRGDEVE